MEITLGSTSTVHPTLESHRLVTTLTLAEPTTIAEARKCMDDSFGPKGRVIDAKTTSNPTPVESTVLQNRAVFESIQANA